MTQSNTLPREIYQFNISTAKGDLEEFEEALQTIQENLKLGSDSQNINKGSVETHITDVAKIRDFLEDMQKQTMETVSVTGSDRLNAITEAHNALEEALAELITSVKLCKRLEVLEIKFGKDAADDMDVTTTNLLKHIRECRKSLIPAVAKLSELKDLVQKA